MSSSTGSSSSPSFPQRPLGALVHSDGVQFRVWAPEANAIELVLANADAPLPLDATGHGYFERFVEGLTPGARYRYLLDGDGPFPDPASHYQPDGVHGPSAVVDPSAYDWSDADWSGIRRDELVFYELHVGTFSAEGTYAGVQKRLGYLKELGVTAIELMPVADFPGDRNWGYDPAAFYAPSRTYGTPDELRALVDAAHEEGLAVFLDVIYNHLGPDGAYLAAFAPMFTDKHETPWGQAINLDDTHSEGVRHLFIDNAIHWLQEYHFDGLRLDATHALKDDSDTHFLAELHDRVEAEVDPPHRHLIAEDPRNLNHFVQPRAEGGFGLDGIWTDDFHHQMRHLTAGDSEGYFANFAGHTAEQIATTVRDGWYYQGQIAPASGAPFGTDASAVDPEACVICIQNHDQVGNRPQGNRLTDGIPLSVYRAATALLLFAPETPLLFMGQEWAASTPFQFFTDHNEELGEQVRQGRREEFEDFSGFQGEIPDPQDPATFERSRLDWGESERDHHARTRALYRDLLALRTDVGGELEVEVHSDFALTVRRGHHHLLVALADDQTLPRPDETTLAFHTEHPKYAADGVAPVIGVDAVEFPRAGATVMIAE